MNFISNPEILHNIELFKNKFLNRVDLISAKHNDKIGPACSLYSLDYILESHLTNEIKVGAYAPDLDGATKWLCIDFDGNNHSNPLSNPKEAAKKTAMLFFSRGIIPHIECSSSGQGYHLWVFFEQAISASEARGIALALIPRDISLKNGDVVDITVNQGIEIFPKSERINAEGVGSAVFLPFGVAAEGSGYYRLNNDNELEKYNPQDFECTPISKVNEILVQFGGIHNISESINHSSTASGSAWDKWRTDSLNLLDLCSVYGEILTGKKTNDEWAEARDPFSKSGDQHPSAGVSTGKNGREAAVFFSFIGGQSISVFDYVRKTKVVEDTHYAACDYISRLVGLELPAAPQSGAAVNVSQNSTTMPQAPTPLRGVGTVPVPVISCNNRQLRDVINDAWQALTQVNNNNLEVFVKAGMLVQLNIKDRLPTIELMNQNEVFSQLSRCATWVNTTNTGIQNVFPPDKVAADMLAYGDPANYGIPPLDFITTSPVFAKTGELVSQEGYSKVARAWYKKTDDLNSLPVIPVSPTPKIAREACDFISDELLYDFPFVSVADKAHWFAALFLPFVRQMVDGPTPLHVVEAPTPGSGKGKLCNLISIIFTGKSCESLTLPSDDDSIRKLLTAELLKCRPLVLFDNVSEKKKVDSPSLASLLTSVDWTDRVLGATRMTTLPNNALWLLTANNPQFSMEIARRCIRVRIDPKIDQPWKRKGFKHEYVEAWAMENRVKLVHAVLILIQSWIAAGKPLTAKRLGTFERWSAVIGGILQHIGMPGFLENLEEMYETSDVEGNEWRLFITRWFEAYGDNLVKISDLVTLADKWDIMTSVIGDGGLKVRQTRLLAGLRAVRDRVIGNQKVTEVKENSKGSFKLVQVNRSENVKDSSNKSLVGANDESN